MTHNSGEASLVFLTWRHLERDPRTVKLVDCFTGAINNSKARVYSLDHPVDLSPRDEHVVLRRPPAWARWLSLHFSAPEAHWRFLMRNSINQIRETLKHAEWLVLADIDFLPLLEVARSINPKLKILVDLQEQHFGLHLSNKKLSRFFQFLVDSGMQAKMAVDIWVTAEESASEKLRELYGIESLTIPNARLSAQFVMRSRAGLKGASQLNLVHHGYLFPGRGLELYVGSMLRLRKAFSDRKITLTVFTPSGVLRRVWFVLRHARLALSGRLKVRPAVSWKELPVKLSMFDLGLSVIENFTANGKSAYPNKLFDYVAAGIPFVAGCSGATERLTKKLGQVFCPGYSPELFDMSLIQALSNLSELSNLASSESRLQFSLDRDYRRLAARITHERGL